jgi:crotonobetainyl-CoA:carnitine CoA-transferase CaiB-like acyl-CoA transferase
MRPLDDMRVIEVGDFVSAPYCGSLLADLGATVIKVEPPRVGDSSRYYGPFPNDRLDADHSGLFAYLNRNKRSVTLDLATPTGADLLRRLVAHVDVLIENVRVTLADPAALDYASLSAANQSLLMASMSPYGASSPWAGQRAFSVQLTAASGFSATVGDADREPLDLPGHAAEFNAGIDGAAAVLSIWLAAQRGAVQPGQLIDLAAVDSLASLHTGTEVLRDYFGLPPSRRLGPRQASDSFDSINMPCADGMVHVSAVLPGQLEALLDIVRAELGAAATSDDPESLIRAWLETKTRDQILELELERNLGLLPVRTTAEVVGELGVARAMSTAELASGEPLLVPRPAISFVDEAAAVDHRPGRVPRLGEANLELLGDLLGIPREDLTLMFQTGVI